MTRQASQPHRWILILLVLVMTMTITRGYALPPDFSSAHGPSIGVTEKPTYLKRFKEYRCRNQLRHSDDLLFNDVRRDLLMGIIFEKNRRYGLIDNPTRKTLYRQSALPPGIQKQLIKGEGVPPGYLNRIVKLPVPVTDYLGFPTHTNVRVGVLGDDVLLYNTSDGVIYDILRNFF